MGAGFGSLYREIHYIQNPDSLYRDLSFHDIQFFPLQEEIINTVWQCREFSKIRSNRSMCFSFYSVEPVQGKMKIIYVHNKYICLTGS